MKRKRMQSQNNLTLKEACEKYLDNCVQRNLSEFTVLHYRESYNHFYKFFDAEMPLDEMTKEKYDAFLGYLRTITNNDRTIRCYQRNLMTVLRYLMREGYMEAFEMQAVRVGRNSVETYSDEELQILLKKPDMKKCTYLEYQCWVMVNLLFSTGIRQRSMLHLQVKDVDFENALLTVRITKNRKVLVLPLNHTMVMILKEFLKHRQHKNKDAWLFCNVYEQQLVKTTCYRMLADYNKNRGVETTGIHRFRHTFAKQWILNGGNVVSLSRLLGHSSLNITQNYINLLTTDLSKQVEDINLLDKYAVKKRIKL